MLMMPHDVRWGLVTLDDVWWHLMMKILDETWQSLMMLDNTLSCFMINDAWYAWWWLITLVKAIQFLTILYHTLCMILINYPWWLIIWNLPGLCACGHTCGQHWRAPSQWSRAPRRCHQTISPPRPTYPQVTQTWAPAWLLFSGRPDIRNWSNIFGHHFQNIVWKMLAWTNYSLAQIIVLGPLNKN